MRGIKKDPIQDQKAEEELPSEDLETPAFIRRSLNKKPN
jgi:hypothetical protein